MHSKTVYLSLGSNQGDRISILQSALKEIQALPSIEHFKSSRFYQTSPVSPIPQNDFINAACSFACKLTPYDLLQHLQKIEKNLGKTPKAKNAPRLIDIDILLYDERWIDTPELKIPHPGLKKRLFVLIPLSDLTKKLMIPQVNGNVEQLILKDYYLILITMSEKISLVTDL